MKQNDFFEFNLDVLVKRVIDSEGEKFNWTFIHEIKFVKGQLTMSFRYQCFGEEDYRTVDLGQRGKSTEDLVNYKSL